MTAPPTADDLAAFYGDPSSGGAGGPGGGASAAARVAAVAGGVVLVGGALLVSGGLALLGFLGMGVAAYVQHRRGRPYSRPASWLGAVGASTLGLLALAAVLAAFIPAGVGDTLRRDMRAAAEQPPPPTAADSVLGRMMPGGRAAGEAQRQAILHSISGSNATMYAFFVIIAIFSCGVWGACIGSAAWGSATVLAFGALGRWPGARARPAIVGDPTAPYVPAYAPDRFDRI